MNKKLFLKLFLSAILINAMTITTISAASANDSEEISELDSIRPYTEILDNLNQELGTEFAFPTNEVLKKAGMVRSEVIADIRSTKVEDFEQLIRDEYLRFKEDMSDNAEVELMATTQKAYYSGSNYVSISASTYYADGQTRYSSLNGYSYGYTSTPYYKPISYTSDLSSDSTVYDCVFTAYKMLSSSVSYDSWTTHAVSASFSAGHSTGTGHIVY